MERVANVVSKYKLGNPLDEESTLGPMANVWFANLVREQMQKAVSQGAKTLIGADLFAADDGGTNLMPQILVDVDHDMEFMRKENFGSVVGIMSVKNDSEAVELMNDSEHGLTASLWTIDSDDASKIGRQLSTWTVFMNRLTIWIPRFAGQDARTPAGVAPFQLLDTTI